MNYGGHFTHLFYFGDISVNYILQGIQGLSLAQSIYSWGAFRLGGGKKERGRQGPQKRERKE